MIARSVDLGNGTELQLVIAPLKGTDLRGQWKTDNDLLLLCLMQTGRFCTCHKGDPADRFVDKLALPRADAQCLAEWLKKQAIE